MLAGEDLRLSNPARHHAHSFTVQIAAAADSDLQANVRVMSNQQAQIPLAHLKSHQQ